MGAYTFECTAAGPTASDAFNNAVDAARYEYGHGGYTGTIAEKTSFVMVAETPMALAAARTLANQLIGAEDERINDQRGPAGAIQLDTGAHYFFGWARS